VLGHHVDLDRVRELRQFGLDIRLAGGRQAPGHRLARAVHAAHGAAAKVRHRAATGEQQGRHGGGRQAHRGTRGD
jgi:hypothetical protein